MKESIKDLTFKEKNKEIKKLCLAFRIYITNIFAKNNDAELYALRDFLTGKEINSNGSSSRNC